MKNNKGFSFFEVLIVIGVVAILGLASFIAYQKQQDKKVANDNTSLSNQSAQNGDIPKVPEVNESSDLDEAQKTLESIDVESSEDETKLEEDLSAI